LANVDMMLIALFARFAAAFSPQVESHGQRPRE
jgi:hypothetical protein